MTYSSTNCVLFASIGCACLTHISFAILLSEHVECMILSIQGHPFVVLIDLIFLAKWMDKNA
jgi:hypothetical protein